MTPATRDAVIAVLERVAQDYVTTLHDRGKASEALALLRSSPPDDWQDISSAPRDNPMRCILVCWLGQTQPACWDDKQQNWQEWPDGDFALPGEVTHWRPLPPPPEAKSEEGK